MSSGNIYLRIGPSGKRRQKLVSKLNLFQIRTHCEQDVHEDTMSC